MRFFLAVLFLIPLFFNPATAFGWDLDYVVPADPQWELWEKQRALLLPGEKTPRKFAPFFDRAGRALVLLSRAQTGDVPSMLVLANACKPEKHWDVPLPARPVSGMYPPESIANPVTSPDTTATLYYWLDKVTAMTTPGFPEYMLSVLADSPDMDFRQGKFTTHWSASLWMEAAAKAGFPPAMFGMYQTHERNPEREEEALAWLKKAAEQGCPQALEPIFHNNLFPGEHDAILARFMASLATEGPFINSIPSQVEKREKAIAAGEVRPGGYFFFEKDITYLRLEALRGILEHDARDTEDTKSAKNAEVAHDAPKANQKAIVLALMKVLLLNPDVSTPEQAIDVQSLPFTPEQNAAIIKEVWDRMSVILKQRRATEQADEARRAAVAEAITRELEPLSDSMPFLLAEATARAKAAYEEDMERSITRLRKIHEERDDLPAEKVVLYGSLLTDFFNNFFSNYPPERLALLLGVLAVALGLNWKKKKTPKE